MNRNTLALIIQEGTRIVTELLRHKSVFISQREPAVIESAPMPQEEAVSNMSPQQATAIATGCVPCSIGHLGTCSGLLNEAMRFARKDGLQSDEVINRVNMCMDELNALERVDLRPEMIQSLPGWEKGLAEQALNLSRTLRHDLEGLNDVSQLETVSAKTQSIRQDIGRTWFRERLTRMTPEQRQRVEDELRRRAEEKEEQEEQSHEEAATV